MGGKLSIELYTYSLSFSLNTYHQLAIAWELRMIFACIDMVLVISSV